MDGHAFLSAIRSEGETRHGAACGHVGTATRPVDAGTAQSSPRARAVLAVGRSSVGLPWSRLAGDHAMVGVPVPEATQWEQIERVADGGSVVLQPLECLAAQGELISQDDTTVRRLALMAEHHHAQAHAETQGIARSKDRTGM